MALFAPRALGREYFFIPASWPTAAAIMNCDDFSNLVNLSSGGKDGLGFQFLLTRTAAGSRIIA